MNSRKDAYLGSERSYLVYASAVNTLAVIQPLSYDSFLCLVHYLSDYIGKVLILLGECFEYLVLDRNESCVSYCLIVCIKCILELIAELLSDLIHHIVVKLHRLELELGLSDLLLDIGNECDHILYFGMTELDSFEHKIVGYLVSACLDHYDLLGRACNGEVEVVMCSLLKSRIENELSVNIAYVDRCNRSVPRDIGDRDSYRCSDHSCDLG